MCVVRKNQKLVAPFDRGKSLGLLHLEKSDIMNWPGPGANQLLLIPQQSTRTFTRSLAFEFFYEFTFNLKTQKQATE